MNKNKELNDYFFEKINKYKIIKTFKRNEFIYSEFDNVDNVFIVKNGKVELFKLTKDWEERLIFILDDNIILNEEILFNDKSECATSCRAYEDAEIIIVPKSVVLNEMNNDILIMKFILENTNTKLKRTYRQLKNSGSSISIEKKIISKLYRLSIDYGVHNENEVLINMTLSNSTLSKMVGAKRETVSRCINKLKKDGLIDSRSDKIVIVDMKKLLKLLD